MGKLLEKWSVEHRAVQITWSELDSYHCDYLVKLF